MPLVSAERDVLDWLTLLIALTALFLGFRNAWAARERVELHLEGAFLDPLPGREDDGNCIVVVRNPSPIPVQVDDVGFRLRSGRRVPAEYHDGKPFPQVVETGKSTAAYSNIIHLAIYADPDEENDPATHAWVRRPGRRYTEIELPKGWLERWTERHGGLDEEVEDTQ